MKKSKLSMLLAVALAATLVFGGTAFASEADEDAPSAGEEAESDETGGDEENVAAPDDINDYLWEITDDMDFEEALKLEKRNFKIVQAMEPLFDADSYTDYSRAIAHLKTTEDQESLDAAIEARAGLIQNDSVADRVWSLWNNDPPILDGESYTEEDLDGSSMDGYGQDPIVIKYLLDDPTQAKGNIVVVSGGAMTGRSNNAEGYPGCQVFNDLGYNCFLLQRRVQPYSDEDIFMDFQRAVRLVRYNAEQEGWGGTDMIAGIGWSGGGFTVMGAINYAYGDLTPVDLGATSYVPDEIDEVNSDMDVAMIIYGATGEINPENTNWPAFYICAGTADDQVDPEGSITLYDEVKDVVPAELKMIEDAPHGYGVGVDVNGDLMEKYPEECAIYPSEADEFMQENLGHSGNAAATSDGSDEAAADDSYPDIPAEYTKVLTYFGTYGFGDAEITVAMSDDDSQIYYSFVCFDEDQIMEGTVEDGVVDITYDLTGFVTQDAQQMYEDALASGEEWTAR